MSRTGRSAVIVIVAILIVVAIGLAVSYKKKSTTNNNSTASSNIQTVTTVTYNGKSFVPADISINLGTTITFVNNSSTPVQVASDDAGFNSGKSIGKGESYSFTFHSKGNFTYKNTLSTGQTGKVTVL